MKVRAPIFLDTGIFVALLDRSDHHHPAAATLFSEPPRRWCTSLAVVSEGYGWFLHRLGEEAARRFRLLIDDLPRLELPAIDATVHRQVVRKLDALRGHKSTYVDAASLVLMRNLGITEVWGTDRDLALEGARVVPLARR